MWRLSPEFDQESTFVTARLSGEECLSVAEGLRRAARHMAVELPCPGGVRTAVQRAMR